MDTSRRALLGAAASWVVVAAASGPARSAAETWPIHPVRIVVPFAPGGGADIIARMLAPRLQQQLEQSFYVDNRAGAAGRIGAGAVAKAEADGHT
ncbi:MAG: tripartite tricarboxylate transporter substrate binding protein, partial [Xanthobacteraceae bacterium]|nr:tripartite tricarboxylate transporter substrate binding protein [Xanthobacteraceae bacterium]